MHRDGDASTAGLAALIAMALSAATPALPQDLASASLDARDEKEAFLSTAQVVTAAPADGRPSWRASLRSGARTHDASVETADGSGPTRRDHRLNVAAYELDKLLGLRLVRPSVARLVDGRPASVTWWVDDLAMDELTRRKRGVAPRDPDAWTRQMQAVRVFDELISNTYRDTSPPLYLNSVWDNLLITTDWTVWLVDHTGAFRTRATLNDVETLAWCANLGGIELHPFLHRVPDIDRPTHLAFDLDPGEGADIFTCIEVATLLKELFDGLGLRT